MLSSLTTKNNVDAVALMLSGLYMLSQRDLSLFTKQQTPIHLEPQRGEEPAVLSCIVALLKFILHNGTGFCAGLRSLRVGAWGRKSSDIDSGFDLIAKVEGVSGGHEMVIVDNLDKDSQLGAHRDFLLRHRLLHSAWVFFDASYDAMAVGMLVGPIVLALEDHGLLPSILALQDDNDLSGLQTVRMMSAFSHIQNDTVG